MIESCHSFVAEVIDASRGGRLDVCHPPASAYAETQYVIDAHFLKAKMLVDGKLGDWRMIVNLSVDMFQGRPCATWDSVFIQPDTLSGGKKVVLRADHYSSEGKVIPDIRNPRVSGNKATFDLFWRAKVQIGTLMSVRGVSRMWSVLSFFKC